MYFGRSCVSGDVALLIPPSFPTRRSSDLARRGRPVVLGRLGPADAFAGGRAMTADRSALVSGQRPPTREDRKSTRLNSSHITNSYAVFCLKKKKNTNMFPLFAFATFVLAL